tara:strand:+ start:2057 stop:3556 length:1500 start_codon:yes stop_codon:yes gene_type:complete
MADLDNNILVVVEPSIRPTKVEVPRLDEDKEADKQSKAVGTDEPLAIINGYIFRPTDTEYMSLDTNGATPTLLITLRDSAGGFEVSQYPRDGDHITLYINSKNQETFKSIHMDFDITSIISPPAGLPNSERTYTFTGIAKVPGLYSEQCRSFESGTSLDHIEQVATELGLGVATNIDSTSDEQIRIQPFDRTFDFIQNIVDTSYVGEEAFQDFYIDQYYYLNFVEINKVFNSVNQKGEDGQDIFSSFDQSFSQDKGTEENDNLEGKLYLTNNQTAEGTGQKISQYTLENNSNTISLNNGYKRTLAMYDDLDEELKSVEFDIESFTSTNLRDMEEPLKGRRDESHYETHIKNKYIGRMQDNALEGNVHMNHKYSFLNNYQNIVELEKMKLIVELQQFNPGLYKFQKVPVIMYHVSPTQVEGAKINEEVQKEKGVKTDDKAFDFKNEGEGEGGNDEAKMDDFLSGHYVVGGIEYIYENGKKALQQKITLLRREWPVLTNTL